MTGARAAAVRTLFVAAAAFAVGQPALSAGFIYDDHRFIEESAVVHDLSWSGLPDLFLDPAASNGAEGNWTYRPLRTLHFQIDWAVSGGDPAWFHLVNLLWHAAGAALVHLLLLRLTGSPAGALLGALVYAVHPVQAESFAWVTSRGDVMLAATLAAALLAHLGGRTILAFALLVAALFVKESAVVFPALALLCDRFAGRGVRWKPLLAYGAAAAAFAAFWFLHVGGGHPKGMWHVPHFWGGSYGGNLLTMAKGFAYYLKMLLLPTETVLDYYVPVSRGFGAGEIAAAAILLLAAVGVWRGGRPARFAAAFAFVALLPMSNLLFPIRIPTADRFLLVPMIGVAAWAGPVLARFRPLAYAVPVCLFAMAFARSGDFKSEETIWAATLETAETPASLLHRMQRRFNAGDLAGARADAAAHARLFAEDVGVDPGPDLDFSQSLRARAELLLGEPEAALATARAAAARSRAWPVHHALAAEALHALGRIEEAVGALEVARRAGHEPEESPRTMARWLNEAARAARAAGDHARARALYERSWSILPDPAANYEALRNR